MEGTFDFRHDADIAGEVSAEIDYLSTGQLVKVHKYIQDIQKEGKEKQSQDAINWFEQVIVPLLKEFAQENDACLEVRPQEEILLATFHNDVGFNFDIGQARMRMMLDAADNLSIERSEEECVLVLTFDCSNL